MAAVARSLELRTTREGEVVDITDEVAAHVASSGVQVGMALVFTQSSTSAITVLEHEPGLVQDLPAALDRLVPRHGAGVHYGHERMWGDGNGHSHVRAAMLKPDLVVPVSGGRPVLGRWQQIVFVELDVRPRDRVVHVHVVGE